MGELSGRGGGRGGILQVVRDRAAPFARGSHRLLRMLLTSPPRLHHARRRRRSPLAFLLLRLGVVLASGLCATESRGKFKFAMPSIAAGESLTSALTDSMHRLKKHHTGDHLKLSTASSPGTAMPLYSAMHHPVRSAVACHGCAFGGFDPCVMLRQLDGATCKHRRSHGAGGRSDRRLPREAKAMQWLLRKRGCISGSAHTMVCCCDFSSAAPQIRRPSVLLSNLQDCGGLNGHVAFHEQCITGVDTQCPIASIYARWASQSQRHCPSQRLLCFLLLTLRHHQDFGCRVATAST